MVSRYDERDGDNYEKDTLFCSIHEFLRLIIQFLLYRLKLTITIDFCMAPFDLLDGRR